MQANWNVSLRSLLIIICCAWLPEAWAQGLGEMTPASSINQPFRADIALLDIGDLDATQIVVGLATQEEFANAGLERPGVLNSLQFEVEVSGDGTGVVHVSSVGPIEEPFLNFMLRARWPDGSVLREYTALLDLPTFAANPNQTPAPAVQPAQSETAPAPAVANPPRAEPAVPPAPAASTDTATSAQEYTVQDGDSMWEIAASTRPAGDVSVQQMMVAIQRANESAFINNNINRVRSGRVLRIPGAEEIRAIDQETAVAAINQQNQQLSSQPLAVNTTAPAAGPAPASDELTILSGNDNGGVSTGSDLDDSIAALENDLMLSEEGLDRARLENLELTNRLAALQEQIDLLQNMISLEDARIAQLQAELSEQADQTEQTLAEAQTAADNLANEAAAAEEEGGLAGLLKNTAVLTGGLVALVLLALGGLMIRKRSIAMADDNTFDFEATEAEAKAATAPVTEEAQHPDGDKREKPPFSLAAAVAAFFARFRREDATEEYQEEPPAEVTGGSYGPDAAFRNPPDEAKVEPVLAPQTEEDLLAAEALADEAFDQVEKAEVVEEEEAALSKDGTISYVEPAITSQEEDLLAEAGDLLAAAAPEPVVEAPVQTVQVTVEPVVEAVPEEVAQQEEEADTPDVFEFSLRNDAAAAAAKAAAPPPPAAPIETIAFTAPPAETPASAHASEYQQVANLEEPPASEIEDDMVDLAFDDTFVADAAEEDGSYEPATPNNAQDAKLDLAVAYEAMGDIDGAIEILDEVIGAGTAEQVAEAERLKAKWQNS